MELCSFILEGELLQSMLRSSSNWSVASLIVCVGVSASQVIAVAPQAPSQLCRNSPLLAAQPVFTCAGSHRQGDSHPQTCCLDRLERSNDSPATLGGREGEEEVRVRIAALVALRWWCGDLTTGHCSPSLTCQSISRMPSLRRPRRQVVRLVRVPPSPALRLPWFWPRGAQLRNWTLVSAR